MEKAILTQQELQSNLERFATFYSSQTNKGTYRTTGRNSLLKDGLGTRANSIWKMAEYIVATYEDSDKPIQAYLDGWHALSKNFRDQFLFLEIEPNTWNLYDWSGKLLNESVPIEFFFQSKEREHRELLEKYGEQETIIAEEILTANSFRQFVRSVLLHLYGNDKFECFFNRLIVNNYADGTFRSIAEGLNLYFRADDHNDDSYWEDEFVVDGTSWYLKNNPKSEGFSVFASFINKYYPEYYAEKRGTQFFLYCAPKPFASREPRQVIYFGAPGTGKSFEVQRIINERAKKRNIRTTFHPDTDYSSFVGCFKPTMKNGNIEYRFTPQAFVNAYVKAWTDLSKPFFLVIEEINRGNCAQIFGDIFQLLDRNSDGESSYAIQPDTDLQKYLASQLGEIPNIPLEIALGQEMRLPANMFIYATMNTSDQSLFPIDSAFKRRWDWRYTAIKPGDKEHILNVNGNLYKWTSFIELVNAKIYDLTKNEDKQLGYWFIKPDDNGHIDWTLFVSKALFYIWNDVIKDFAQLEKSDSAFGKKFAFTSFFNANGEPQSDHVIDFLETLGVKRHMPVEYALGNDDYTPANEPAIGYGVDNPTDDDHRSKGSKYSYILDGEYYSGIGKVVRKVIDTLCQTMTFDSLKHDFDNIVKKTYENGSCLRLGTAEELGRDENGRMRWYKDPFTSSDGKVFSVISLWPDSYYLAIKRFVEYYPSIFPGGLTQNISD